MTYTTHSKKEFKDLQNGDRFYYNKAKFWATATGTPIATINEKVLKVTIATGSHIYGNPRDFVEFKSNI